MCEKSGIKKSTNLLNLLNIDVHVYYNFLSTFFYKIATDLLTLY
jgi:hypothetical protein